MQHRHRLSHLTTRWSIAASCAVLVAGLAACGSHQAAAGSGGAPRAGTTSPSRPLAGHLTSQTVQSRDTVAFGLS